MTLEGAKYFSDLMGAPVRNQLHGLDVYEALPNQKFLRVDANPTLSMGVDSTIATICSWYEENTIITQKQELAAEIYLLAQFDTQYRSRFLTLMTAIEALLVAQPRSQAVRELVTSLECAVADSPLEKSQIQSLMGSLKWLHHESIGQSGRRMAAQLLPDRTYSGLSSEKYFQSSYELRSSIVHSGRVPKTVDLLNYTNELHRFTGDLIQASIGIPQA